MYLPNEINSLIHYAYLQIQVALMKESFLLDPGIIFLNQESFRSTPKPVFEIYQHWQRELERKPVVFGDDGRTP